MNTVLFVCTGNSCRSPMAEAIFDELIDDHPRLKTQFRSESAGTLAFDGADMTEMAQNALESIGVHPARHRSRQITEEMAREAYLILTMESQHLDELEAICPAAAEKAHTLKGYVSNVEGYPGDSEYDIEDPYRQPFDVYREAAEEIRLYIAKLLDKLEKTV